MRKNIRVFIITSSTKNNMHIRYEHNFTDHAGKNNLIQAGKTLKFPLLLGITSLLTLCAFSCDAKRLTGPSTLL